MSPICRLHNLKTEKKQHTTECEWCAWFGLAFKHFALFNYVFQQHVFRRKEEKKAVPVVYQCSGKWIYAHSIVTFTWSCVIQSLALVFIPIFSYMLSFFFGQTMHIFAVCCWFVSGKKNVSSIALLQQTKIERGEDK